MPGRSPKSDAGIRTPATPDCAFKRTLDGRHFEIASIRSQASAEAGMQPKDRIAAALRGFGPAGFLAILVVFAGNLVVVPLSAILVLLWAQRSGTPLSALGFVRPRSWVRTVFVGISFGIALKFLMKAVVMPLLAADPINQTYHYLVGNQSALPGMFYAIIIGAGFGEETLFPRVPVRTLGRVLRAWLESQDLDRVDYRRLVWTGPLL